MTSIPANADDSLSYVAQSELVDLLQILLSFQTRLLWIVPFQCFHSSIRLDRLKANDESGRVKSLVSDTKRLCGETGRMIH